MRQAAVLTVRGARALVPLAQLVRDGGAAGPFSGRPRGPGMESCKICEREGVRRPASPSSPPRGFSRS